MREAILTPFLHKAAILYAFDAVFLVSTSVIYKTALKKKAEILTAQSLELLILSACCK